MNQTTEGAGRNDHIHGDENLARELGQYECDCGADYARDVAREGYPKWHAPLGHAVHFVEECSFLCCDKRVCHTCATTCKICGARYCPKHSPPDFASIGLCDDCIGIYPDISAGAERNKLIEVEAHIQDSRYYHIYGSLTDLSALLAIAKAALTRITELEAAARTGRE